MAVSTRPLTLGEILDRTVQLYRRNFLLFVGVSIPPTALTVLISGAVAIFFVMQMPGMKPPDNATFAIFGVVMVLVFLVGAPILLAAFALALGASNFAVLHANRGEKVTIRASYGYAFRHFWRHLGILFLQSLFSWVIPYAVFVGFFVVGIMLTALFAKSGGGGGAAMGVLFLIFMIVLAIALVVAGFWLWLRFSLAFPASVAEDAKIWPSMMRSGRLTAGTRWRIFVMFLLVGALSTVVSLALMIPVFIFMALFMQKSFAGPSPPTGFMVGFQVANLSISFLVRAFIMPIYAISLVLFYFDQRTRQEGFDIEQLMHQAGWSQTPSVPVPAPAPFTSYPPPGPYAPGYASESPFQNPGFAPRPPAYPPGPPAPVEATPDPAPPAPALSDQAAPLAGPPIAEEPGA